MTRIAITDHFRRAYFSRIEDLSEQPKVSQDAAMTQHIRDAQPVSEMEMLVIRKSKRVGMRIKDYIPEVRHLIDRAKEIVFVVKEIMEKEGQEYYFVATTCYVAPYLSFLRPKQFSDEEREIRGIIEEVRLEKCASPMRFGVFLYKLWARGYLVTLGGDHYEFELGIVQTGLWVRGRKIGKAKWKNLDFNKLRPYIWFKAIKRWTFQDFGIASLDLRENGEVR